MKHNERLRRIISFPDKYAAFRHVVSTFMFLPGLRGLWTANHLGATGNLLDWTGFGMHLTANGTPGFNYDGLASYVTFDGATDYFSRPDEAGLSVTGSETFIDSAVRGLTLGCWFYSTDATALQMLVAKLTLAAGNYSYYIAFAGATAGDPARFWMSDDGTNSDSVESSNSVTTSAWHYVVGRFNDNDSGEELAIFLDGVKTTGTTARASIFDGNAALEVGSGQGANWKLTGRMSIAYLCCVALSDDMIGATFQQSRALYGI